VRKLDSGLNGATGCRRNTMSASWARELLPTTETKWRAGSARRGRSGCDHARMQSY